MSIFSDSYFVVGFSFFLFLSLLAYLGVHKFILKALDGRADRIRSELEEARRLREEAQAAFAEFERKQKDVERLAEEITTKAREDAEAAKVKALADLDVSIERKKRAAQEQIEMAEKTAIANVRERAAEVAVAAASRVISEKLDDSQADALTDKAIETVAQRLH